MRIELSWPPKELSPNKREHHRYNKAPRDKSRNEAFYATKAVAVTDLPENPLLDISFYPPDRKRRDLDNMFASMKYAIDGIALALGVDDYNFSYKIQRCEPVKGGKVVIEII